TTHRFISCERHDSVALGTFDPVIVPFEGDASFVTCNEAAVGDGDPVSIAGEITQNFLGAAKWAFAVHPPLALAQRRQIGAEGLCVGKLGMAAEELQLTGFVSGGELVEQ